MPPVTFDAAAPAFAAAVAFALAEALEGLDLPDLVPPVLPLPVELLGVVADAATPPPPFTWITYGFVEAAFAGALLVLSWPIRTPTPIASSSVATPATNVAPDEAERWRRCARGACGTGAAAALESASENRGFDRRSPQSTQ